MKVNSLNTKAKAKTNNNNVATKDYPTTDGMVDSPNANSPSIDEKYLSEIINLLIKDLNRAKQKHPDFVSGKHAAVACLAEEFGEVVKEVTKASPGWEERMRFELIDLMTVAVRMYKGEYINE